MFATNISAQDAAPNDEAEANAEEDKKQVELVNTRNQADAQVATLKKELASEYPSMTIENTLFDIFQDKSLNINRIILEIENYQNSISKNTQLKVFENNLGILTTS